MKTFLPNLSIDLLDEFQNTIKSNIGGIIIANVLLAIDPTREMNKSIRGTLIASKNVNITKADLKQFSIKL